VSSFRDLDNGPPPRPASPFALLLLGGAATALSAEWLRFQGATTLAIVPAALGSVVTITSVARAYRARRRWRRENERRSTDVVVALGEAVDPASLLTIREEDGRLAIVRAVTRDQPPSPLRARPAGESSADPLNSALGANGDPEASQEQTQGDVAEAADRQPSNADGLEPARRPIGD